VHVAESDHADAIGLLWHQLSSISGLVSELTSIPAQSQS
jgi:hypothetical protein